MYLLIDTNESRFSFFQEKESFGQLQWNSVDLDQSLTREIRSKKTNFKGIMVLQGKGGFSQTREGVVFANIFHQAKQIPVLSVNEEDIENKGLEALKEDLLISQKNVLLPHYFAQPNIS